MTTTPWLDRQPGLREAGERWLADLDDLLARADRRGRRLLRADPITSGAVPRLLQLLGTSAPRLAGPLARRDGEAIIQALAETALNGGPTYVKLGQFISTTRGLVPAWVADAFAGCRDEVPPASPTLVAGVLRKEGLLDKLADWDPYPIASASVAQVHKATLPDGREVALKVRRPGIVGTVAADAAYLQPLLALLENRDDRLRVANLGGTLRLMLRLFAQEVDMRLEAASIVQMALAFERAGVDVQVPAPIPGLVTKRALVMEFVEGVSAADVVAANEFGHRASDLVSLAITGTLETTLVDGIFHGDLHPGNILVNERGLALIDYGIIGRLSDNQRAALARLLVSGLTEDRPGVVGALVDFGALPEGADVDGFLDSLPGPPTMEERIRMLQDPSFLGERLTELLTALIEYGFRVPPQLTLFFRNVVYLGDALERHAPDFDMLDQVAKLVVDVVNRSESSEPAAP